MNFKLEKLIPLPMLEIPTMGSDIWEAESFIFAKGKSYLVEAASGKGKTSLLSILYGLRRDYQGDFLIDNENAKQISSKQWSILRKERISYIFQGLELFEDLSGIDNILLKNNITGCHNIQEIYNMTERLGVKDFLHKRARFLSFGQRQRIAIVRALCQPFDFLFADESFSHIDDNNSRNALELIKEECAKRNAGLILTSLGKNNAEFDYKISV